MQRNTWLKAGLVALLIVGVPWLFLRTVQNTIAEPYVIEDASLSGWTLALAELQPPSTVTITVKLVTSTKSLAYEPASRD